MPRVKEELSPKYPDVLEKVVARNVDLGTSEPTPDSPYTRGPDQPWVDAGHVNPAIEPAPIWDPPVRPDPVPVINDPGLLGAQPSLADLNRAAAASYGVPETDPTSGITEENHLEGIREAAVSRLERLKGEVKERAEEASGGAQENLKRGSKIGSASKA